MVKKRIFHFDEVVVEYSKMGKNGRFPKKPQEAKFSCVLPGDNISDLNNSETVRKRLFTVLGLFRKGGTWKVAITHLHGKTELLDSQELYERGLPLITFRVRRPSTNTNNKTECQCNGSK
jgi:hypothetical protein